ncbi:MAG: Nif3-like dinuclear metal center hexameric protein [Ignavibacteria bacterium]|nr:Nif3-like dinuclear metal center hexameric protein [Ignavibacteria bacterium]
MKHKEVFEFIEDWAPKGIAWERDNVGLQVGNDDDLVKGLLLTLDISEDVIRKAIESKCNLIISHHPLLFNPLSKIDVNSSKGRIIELALKNGITIYSAHTNLDFTKDGVSFALARKLGLEKIKFLEFAPSTQYKLVTFVPEEHVENLLEKLSQAGAGIIGDYTHCSYQLKGSGTFFGKENTNPAIGEKGKLEKVDEIRLEMIFEKWNLNKILKALLSNHPYEEPAYDIYPLQNRNVNFGFGAVGYLKEKIELIDFVNFVKKQLGANSVKFTSGNKKYIQKIGVCGGSGSDLIPKAINENCDAFVSSDIKYHTFLDYGDSIALIDAGHYYTELPIIDELEKRLNEFFVTRKTKAKVIKYKPKNKIKVVE